MPNHVLNKITIDTSNSTYTLEDILSKIAYNEESFKKYCPEDIFNPLINSIDFNLIVPMPKSLEVKENTDSELAFKYILNLKGTTTKEVKELIKIWNEYSFFEIKDAKLTATDLNKIKNNQAEYAITGLLIKNNIKKYGYPNWYGWRRDNWSTKWNAYEFYAGELTNQIIFYTADTMPLKIYKALAEMFPDVIFTYEWASEDIGSETGYAVVNNTKLLDCTVYNEYEKDSIEYAKNLWNSIR